MAKRPAAPGYCWGWLRWAAVVARPGASDRTRRAASARPCCAATDACCQTTSRRAYRPRSRLLDGRRLCGTRSEVVMRFGLVGVESERVSVQHDVGVRDRLAVTHA